MFDKFRTLRKCHNVSEEKDIKDAVHQMAQSIGDKPKFGLRANHGSWIGPAMVVVELVGKGWGVSDAVRKVAAGIEIPEKYSFSGIRGAYYQLKIKSKQTKKA